MNSCEDIHVVYLIEDQGSPYIGITITRRFENRKASHCHSGRFSDDFTMTVIYSSKDRDHIEDMEEEFIRIYDSYHNGLNLTESGKGWGHKSKKFTTLGFRFSEESKARMSESRKKAIREGRATVPVCPTHILQEVGSRSKGSCRFQKVTKDLAIEIIKTYINRPHLGDGFYDKHYAKANNIFMSYKAAFLSQKAIEYGVRERAIGEILEMKSYRQETNPNRNNNHKMDFYKAEKIRNEFNERVPLDGVSYSSQKSWYSSYERAFSAAYSDYFGVSNVTIYNIIKKSKEGKYSSCWIEAESQKHPD